MSKLEKYYDNRFYDGQSGSSERSAEGTLPILFDIIKPKSAIDFGCGVGTWLKVAKALGVKSLHGVEGPWVKKEQLLDKDIELTNTNFDKPELPEGRWDVAISMEVAEHIEPASSEAFVQGICSTADTVLFSAAIPNQYGENHINEQWQSYWVELFAGHGYEAFDLVRPLIWGDQNVEWYYRQNVLVYCRTGSENYEILKKKSLEVSSRLYDVVHPEVFVRRTSFRGGLSTVKKSLLG